MPLQIPVIFHPRTLTALGSMLVTDDVVALMELIKNSYDACATQVTVKFASTSGGVIDEIIVNDDGVGMTEDVLRNAWFCIATPYRQSHQYACPNRQRRTTGEKGLGRLSAARLGSRVEVSTHAKGSRRLKFDLDWDEMAAAPTHEEWHASIAESKGTFRGRDGKSGYGTTLRIKGLRHEWTKEDIDQAQQRLSRVLSPWKSSDDFSIAVESPWHSGALTTSASHFAVPPYKISGQVDAKGRAKAVYVTGENPTAEDFEFQTFEGEHQYSAGPYYFEIRAWDLDKESIMEIQKKYESKESIKQIRDSFINSAFAGISLYRDNILALPKSSKSLDWLELESRRVSRVGDRLSRNQIMGVVSITQEHNPDLMDTSDREGLHDNLASGDFFESIKSVIKVFEAKRSKTRQQTGRVSKRRPGKSLLGDLRDDEIVAQVSDALNQDNPQEAKKAVERYVRKVHVVADEVEQRLVTYNRLAALGRLAGFLQHEVGNHTIAIEALVDKLNKKIESLPGDLRKPMERAAQSVRSLKRLAHVFGPLAGQRTRRRPCVLEDVLTLSVETRNEDIEKWGIQVRLPQKTSTALEIDQGELVAIFYNLIDNAIYWMSTVEGGAKVLTVERRIRGETAEISVMDSGPGVDDGDAESIFYPGWTMRPKGLGMGLTIASELVDGAGGQLSVQPKGKLGGATFVFTVPLAKEKEQKK